MLIVSDCISQSSNDTICLPLAQLKKAINKIEEAKINSKEIIILNDKIQIIEKKLAVKDSLLYIYMKNESNYKRIINNYEQSLSNNVTTIDNLEKSIKYHKKIARRQKFQKWSVAFIGIGLGYLLIK
jgi:hypothetical protein